MTSALAPPQTATLPVPNPGTRGRWLEHRMVGQAEMPPRLSPEQTRQPKEVGCRICVLDALTHVRNGS